MNSIYLMTSSGSGGPFVGQYKWLGAVLGSDGSLYCIPYNVMKVLVIKMDDTVELMDIPIKGRNMWQGPLAIKL